jgi:acyl carrier protein
MRQKVINILLDIISEKDFMEDDNLIEEGFLDSLDVIILTCELEKQFNIKIDGVDVKKSNFSTVDDIVRLLVKCGAS